MKDSPLVSVIIPNLHSPIIDNVVESVLRQKYKGKLEIIVVGQDKFRLLDRFKKRGLIKIIETEKPLIPSIARNIGIKMAKGDYLFFLDADCLVGPHWLSCLLKNYDSNDNQVVGGSIIIEKSGNFWRLCDNLAHFYAISARQKKKNLINLATANLSVPRKIIKKVDRFDETLVAGEDKDYLLRIFKAGYTLTFEPKAGAIHLSSRTNFFSVLKHSYFWGPYSLKVRLRYQDIEFLPFFMKNRLSLILMAPIIALGSTLRVFRTSFFHWRFFYTFPIIYISKFFWCLGAGIKKIND